MPSLDGFQILPSELCDQPKLELLLDAAFGLSRRTKTSYRFREGEEPVAGLSFKMCGPDGAPVGCISYWHLRIGEAGKPALLLGPLAVCPELQGIGIGRALMRHSLAIAKSMGHRLVILVGDEPYYGRVGFSKIEEDRLILPGPVDPARLLYQELQPGAIEGARGLVLSPSRYNQTGSSVLRGTT